MTERNKMRKPILGKSVGKLTAKITAKFFSRLLGHAAWISLLTTHFTPLAYAKTNERMTEQRLAIHIKELGLNKKITLGEYWKNAKRYYPAWMIPQLEKLVAANKNKLMPEMQVSKVNSNTGNVIPVLRITENGRTNTLQFFGEKEKYVKFNNTFLSEYDIARVDDAFTRIVASDIKLKKQAEALYFNKPLSSNKASNKPQSLSKKNTNKISNKTSDQQSKDLAKFTSFPRVTPQLWKSLTKEQRVGYIIKMRRMHQAAVAVVAANQGQTKKSSGLDLELFYKTIFGETAQAQANFQGQCIVAGYIGEYAPGVNHLGQRSSLCKVEIAINNSRYQSGDLKFVSEANKTCKASEVACNPLIYGFPGGKAECVSPVDPKFQSATWFGGLCDKESPLTKTKVGDFSKKYSELSREEQLKAIELEQREDYQLTESFLDGVLANRNKGLRQAFLEGKWSSELDNELVRIQSQFEAEIQNSIGICSAKLDNTSGRLDEPKQKEACDQLHRRWLFADHFISKIREKACVAPSKYIWALDSKTYLTDKSNETVALQKNKMSFDSKGTDLCECPNAAKVSFGKSCPASPDFDGPAVTPVDTKQDCIDRNSHIKGIDPEDPCQCKDGSEPKPAKKGSFFSNLFGNDDNKVDDNERICESDSNLLWLLPVGLGLLALIGIFGRDKDPKPVQPVTPPVQPPVQPPVTPPVQPPVQPPVTPPVQPPVVQPPPPACTPPKVGPSCVCPANNACAAAQGIINYINCQCDYPPPVPSITCADGTTASSLANCPKCSNGSYRTTMGCSEGGSGTNNNSGGAGGLPPRTAQ